MRRQTLKANLATIGGPSRALRGDTRIWQWINSPGSARGTSAYPDLRKARSRGNSGGQALALSQG